MLDVVAQRDTACRKLSVRVSDQRTKGKFAPCSDQSDNSVADVQRAERDGCAKFNRRSCRNPRPVAHNLEMPSDFALRLIEDDPQCRDSAPYVAPQLLVAHPSLGRKLLFWSASIRPPSATVSVPVTTRLIVAEALAVKAWVILPSDSTSQLPLMVTSPLTVTTAPAVIRTDSAMTVPLENVVLVAMTRSPRAAGSSAAQTTHTAVIAAPVGSIVDQLNLVQNRRFPSVGTCKHDGTTSTNQRKRERERETTQKR